MPAPYRQCISELASSTVVSLIWLMEMRDWYITRYQDTHDTIVKNQVCHQKDTYTTNILNTYGIRAHTLQYANWHVDAVLHLSNTSLTVAVLNLFPTLFLLNLYHAIFFYLRRNCIISFI